MVVGIWHNCVQVGLRSVHIGQRRVRYGHSGSQLGLRGFRTGFRSLDIALRAVNIGLRADAYTRSCCIHVISFSLATKVLVSFYCCFKDFAAVWGQKNTWVFCFEG